MPDLVKIAALWLNEGKDGKKFMAGYLGDAKLLVFRNNYKEEDKHPDYIVYVAAKEKKKDDALESDPADDPIPF